MPRQATIRYATLRNSLMNMPLSLYAPLVERRDRAHGVAVHLSGTVKGQNVFTHVGWIELAAASSLALRDAGASETVEVDPQYAASLGLAEGKLVEIGLLHDVPVAKHVATEPCSVDDWEIIICRAGSRRLAMGFGVFRVVSTNPPEPCMLSTELSIAPKSRAGPRSAPASKPTTTNQPVAPHPPL